MTIGMRPHLAMFLLATLPVSVAAAQTLPFEGKWALGADRCTVTSGSTEASQPITLTAKRLVAEPFMSCDFSSVLPGGISFRVSATCVANGKKGDEFFTFAVMSGRLYWSWGGKTQSFERCQN